MKRSPAHEQELNLFSGWNDANLAWPKARDGGEKTHSRWHRWNCRFISRSVSRVTTRNQIFVTWRWRDRDSISCLSQLTSLLIFRRKLHVKLNGKRSHDFASPPFQAFYMFQAFLRCFPTSYFFQPSFTTPLFRIIEISSNVYDGDESILYLLYLIVL